MGIDIFNGANVTICWDVTKGLPFTTSTVDEVYSDHFFEHLCIEDVQKLMGEIHRVCKPNALVEIRVPHFSGFTNFYEFHKTSYRHNSFAEYTNTWGMWDSKYQFELLSDKINLVNRQSPKNHRVTKYYLWNYPMEWIVNKMKLVYETTGWCHIFPAWEIIFKMKVRK
ncbi:hypothetical protein LCGC14_0396790 [marine sediment metagenome]|uniref:Methyltransferase type 11 domain-containing protein n=1 Tax=marine sediment metagenome TaxID=412755 RepID=A0A0F9TG71_9ZZZZ